MPRFAAPRLIWTIASSPSSTMMPENTNAMRRFPMKSMLVFPRISSIRSSASSKRLTASSDHHFSELLLPGYSLFAIRYQLLMLDAQMFDLPALVDRVKDHLGAHQRGKQVNRDTETQRHCKTLNRSRAEEKQRKTGDERRHVRVNDRQQRLIVSSIHGKTNRLALPEFLTDAFKNQHIGIHTHPDRQNDPGNARQGQGRIQPRQDADETDQIQGQREVRNQTGEQVIDHHEEHHHGAGN